MTFSVRHFEFYVLNKNAIFDRFLGQKAVETRRITRLGSQALTSMREFDKPYLNCAHFGENVF